MRQAAGRVLVVDDELSVRESLGGWFRRDGYLVSTAMNAEAALSLLGETPFDVALVDIRMPGMDGMELQRRIHEKSAATAVIILTAFASVETAVQALKQGAYDYVTKPVDPDELSHLVKRIFDEKRLRNENEQLKETVAELSGGGDGLVGEAPAMKRLAELIRSVAETDSTVLVRGESGTGKELVARAIHARSRRRFFPIVPVNCGALPEGILESELFGHEKGAFTGAQYRRKGKFEMANGGSLFLDEIGTIAPRTQVDLLRVLETKEITRLGGSTPIHVDFRLICATNQNLEQMLTEGKLREDLYYRINVFTIELPPLRQRKEDVPLLARHFLGKFAEETGKRFTDFSPEALERLSVHDWPGNVRELANAIERAIVVGKAPRIELADLPLRASSETPAAGETLEDVERRHVTSILDRTDGNVTRSAEILGIDRATLYNKMKRWGLKR